MTSGEESWTGETLQQSSLRAQESFEEEYENEYWEAADINDFFHDLCHFCPTTMLARTER